MSTEKKQVKGTAYIPSLKERGFTPFDYKMKYTVEFEIDEKMFKNIIGRKKENKIAKILGMRVVKI